MGVDLVCLMQFCLLNIHVRCPDDDIKIYIIFNKCVMAAILDFSIVSTLLKGDSSTPVWISLWGCQT